MEQPNGNESYERERKHAEYTNEQLHRGLVQFEADHRIEDPLLVATLHDIRDHLDVVSDRLRPVKVIVVGRMQIGKSTFVNTLIGHPILPVGRGQGCTAVVTEITRTLGVGFRAVVTFRSPETIAAFIHYAIEYERNRRPNDLGGNDRIRDSKFEAIRDTLKRLFRLRGPLVKDQVLVAEEILAANIGRESLVLESDTVAGLLALLNPFTRLPADRENTVPQDWQVLTVESVRIEGNFLALPFGVTLVDSPGLGDANDINSERTLALMNAEDVHVWYATSADTALETREDLDFLRRVLVDNPRNRTISIVCTRLDVWVLSTGDDPEVLIRERRSTMASRIRHLYERGQGNGWDEAVRPIGYIPEFGFVSVPRAAVPLGFEFWRQKLVEIGRLTAERLRSCVAQLQQIRTRIENFGLLPAPQNIPEAGLRQWAANFVSVLSELQQRYNFYPGREHEFYSFVESTGEWRAIHHITWAATLDSQRRGIFHADQANVPRFINLNREMALPCLQSVLPLVNDVFTTTLLENLETIRRILGNWPERPRDLLRDVEIDLQYLHVIFNHQRALFFTIEALTTRIRDLLTQIRVYGTGRNRRLSVQEVTSVLEQLRREVGQSITLLQSQCVEFVERIFRRVAPMLQIPDQMRRALLNILQAAFREVDEEGIPYRFRCPICLEVLNDPVSAPSCNHVLCRRCAVSVRNSSRSHCPMNCPGAWNNVQFVHQVDLAFEIQIWRERQSLPRARNPQWWLELWSSPVFLEQADSPFMGDPAEWTAVDQYIAQHFPNAYRVHLLREGFCLFQAASLGLAENGHELVRHQVVEWLSHINEQTHPGIMAAMAPRTHAEYLAFISEEDAWGGEPELIAIATIFEVTIVVIRPNGNGGVTTTRYPHDGQGREIYLAYNGINHYDAIVTNEN